MPAVTLALLAQLALPAQTLPVLSLPEPGVDDTAAYQGYRTRFYRDVAGNTVQVYLEPRNGRVVNLWADADDESLAFTALDATGHPVKLRWGSAGATVSDSGRARVLTYQLIADAPVVRIGWPLMGSMRLERDFQYWKQSGEERTPFGEPLPPTAEIERMLAALDRVAPAERRRQLAILGVTDLRTLRARLQPRVSLRRRDTLRIARYVQPSFDGRDTLAMEVALGVGSGELGVTPGVVSLRSTNGAPLAFTVRIATTARALTPLTRQQIFTSDFLRFLDSASRDSASLRSKWLERQTRSVELLASREKLMAGLPNYATYFGRDMLVSALMMRSIWRPEMSEHAIASALGKLAPNGRVSHEEALGGQAIRESAAEYAALADSLAAARARGATRVADSLLARQRAVLRDLRRTRENYHMVDADFQLPVLAARWLADPTVEAARKRAFLMDSSDGGGTRLARLLRELALVARETAPYAASPTPANLVAFPRRSDGTYASSSWRDSNAGYGGGAFAMDVNAIWAPHALESIARILDALRTLGVGADALVAPDTPLGRYARDSVALRRAVETWRGAGRHFVVRLSPAEVRADVQARLAAMPAPERAYWDSVVTATGTANDSLTFLAVSLDASGRPIGIANSDPATRLFLGDSEGAAAAGAPTVDSAATLRDVSLFVRPYPVGLFIAQVGPVVANDAYASPAVWSAFVRDPYHGPRVVWGREVHLFELGVAQRLAAADAGSALARELRDALQKVHAAVEASGFRSELWSYEVQNGRLVPVRYGTSSDVQLWSTTDLAVQYALSRLGR